MKIINIGDLWRYDISVSGISVIKQTPVWNYINSTGRLMNGFMLMDGGALYYRWKDGSEIISRGDLIYLPKGSVHKCDIVKKDVSYYRINFVMTDMADGEDVILSEGPVIFGKAMGEQMSELCREMCRSCLSNSNFLSLSLFGEFMNILVKSIRKSGESRISAAVYYISAHYTESIEPDMLAGLCHLSKPHLFRLFNSEIGSSPVEYRNKLRIEKAKKLISEGDCGMSEIADILGFGSVYYFSRSFKKEVGMSPLAYKKSGKKSV